MKYASSRLTLFVSFVGFLFGCASTPEASSITSASSSATEETISIPPMPKYDDTDLHKNVFPINQRIDHKDKGAYFLHSLQKKKEGDVQYDEVESDMIGSMLLLQESSFVLYPVGRFLDQDKNQFGFVDPSFIPLEANPNLRVSSFGELEVSFLVNEEYYLCSYRRDILLPMRYDCYYRRENVVIAPAFNEGSSLASRPWVKKKLAEFSDTRAMSVLMLPYQNGGFDPCKRLYFWQTGQFNAFFDGNQLHYLIPSAPLKDDYPSLDSRASFLRLCSADVTPSTERNPITRTYQYGDHSEAKEENPVKDEGDRGLYVLKQRAHTVSYSSWNLAQKSYETFYQEDLVEDVSGVALVKEGLISIIRNNDTFVFEAAAYYENNKQFCPLVNSSSNNSLWYTKKESGITQIYLTLFSDDQGIPVSSISTSGTYTRRKDEYVFELSRDILGLDGPIALLPSIRLQEDNPSFLPEIRYCDFYKNNPSKAIAIDESGKTYTIRLSLLDELYESEDSSWAIRFIGNEKAVMCSNRIFTHQTNLKMPTFYQEISIFDAVKIEKGAKS